MRIDLRTSRHCARGLWAILALAAVLSHTHSTAAQEAVTIQLRWKHQFQFAGYYTALEKGFYDEAGLSVEIIEGGPANNSPISAVLNRQVDFGVSGPGLAIERLKGRPLLAIAAIFQSSPIVWMVRDGSGIERPHDLVGRSAMLMPAPESAELLAMLHLEGISAEAVDLRQTTYDPDDLFSGAVDAYDAYITNEPFVAAQQGHAVRTISPRTYGVDFYSDILFTSEAFADENPDTVRAFREASIRGWDYALRHQAEIVDLILAKYQPEKGRDALLYEAETMYKLINPDIVAIGHMNPRRWDVITQTFKELGMIDGDADLNGFLFDPNVQADLRPYYQAIALSLAAALLLALALFWYIRLTRRLRREVAERIKAETEARRLAMTDPLTGIANRALFRDRLAEMLSPDHREPVLAALALVDLNAFKSVNDTLGHAVGDAVLRAVADRLTSSCRATDIVARIGGDEFAVLIARRAGGREPVGLMQRVLTGLGEPLDHRGTMVNVGCSIGIALCPEHATEPHDLFELADAALYAAKAEGGNSLAVYDPQRPQTTQKSATA